MRKNVSSFLLMTAAATVLAACNDTGAGARSRAADIPSAQGGWRVAPDDDLNGFFDCLDENGVTVVSAHRGGPSKGFPENAIETMAAVLADGPAIMEIDVAASSDGVLYLMHDDTLERTTTGEGAASAAPWSDISALKLEDENGAVTRFAPPKFSDALAWAEGKTILQVDFKRSARYEDVIDEINRQNAEDRVILIAYSFASAQKLHRLAPNAMISLSVNSQSELNRAVAAGVPADRLMAFTGTESPRPRLYGVLEDRDVEVIFGSLGGRNSIDNQIARTGDEDRYAEIAATGVDVLATDRPREAYQALLGAGVGLTDGVCGISKG
ncbi:MAG: glycerophosphodiester phosphodiesterase family protein [Pseudomonadota bacterium]